MGMYFTDGSRVYTLCKLIGEVAPKSWMEFAHSYKRKALYW